MIICSYAVDKKIVLRDLKALVQTEDDMKRMLAILRLYRADEVYLDFFHQWNRIHKNSGEHFFTSMIVAGKYEMALDGLMFHYTKTKNASCLQLALLAAALSGDSDLRKFMHNAPPDYHDVAAGILLGESAALNQKHAEMLLALMEAAITIAPQHELPSKIESLLATTWDVHATLAVARLFYSRMNFAEAARLCHQIIEIAPPDFDLKETARMSMEAEVASGNIADFEKTILLALAYEVSPVTVKQCLAWAMEMPESNNIAKMDKWRMRVECWEKLYLYDIFPGNEEEEQALTDFFNAVEGKGSPESIDNRNFLLETWRNKPESISNEDYRRRLLLQRDMRAKMQSLKASTELTAEQKAESRLLEMRKQHKWAAMLI